VQRGTPHFRAMMLVWSTFHLVLLLLFVSVAIPTVSNGTRFVIDNQDRWADNLGGLLSKALVSIDHLALRFSGEIPDEPAVPPDEGAGELPPPQEPDADDATATEATGEEASLTKLESPASPVARERIRNWINDHGQEISRRGLSFLGAGFEGFLGFFGYLVGFILVPLY